MRRLARRVCHPLAVTCRPALQQQQQRVDDKTHEGDGGAERDVLNSDTIYDIGSGSDYYFPPPSSSRRRSTLNVNTLSQPALSGAGAKKPQRVRLAGVSRYHSLDVSTPPVSAEEAERWKLDQLLYAPAPSFFPNVAETRYLLPPSQQLTSLGPRMAQMEKLYRLKGFFAPSEVAHVFVPITPTFFVESGHVMRIVPPHIVARLEQCMARTSPMSLIFARYPMIFKVNRSTYRKGLVKLNLDFDFIRRYPGCGRGDRLHYHHNAERSALGAVVNKLGNSGPETHATATDACGVETQRATSVRRPIDLQIFEILLRHLPRVPAPRDVPSTRTTTVGVADDGVEGRLERRRQADRREAELYAARYRSLPLVNWVNSFAKDELALLNQVPQQRVVNVMSRFVHVFQLVSEGGEDGNLYTDRSRLLTVYGPVSSAVDQLNASLHNAHVASSICSTSDKEEKAAQPSAPSEHVAKRALSAAEQQRVERFERSLQDGLIDLDETLASPTEEDRHVVVVAGDGDNDDAMDRNNELPYDDEAVDHDDGKEEEEEDVDAVSAERQLASGPVHSARHDEVTLDESEGEEDGDTYVPTNFHTVAVRRLPPNIAPRSLSNFNEHCSPDPDLVQLAASLLAAPPTLAKYVNNYFTRAADAEAARRGTSTPRIGPWRWVRVERVYEALTPTQRRRLRRYKGLANFLRLHGELFELSEDLRHYIAHDPHGTVAPLLPTQRRFGFEERVVLPRSFDDDPSAAAALIGETERTKYETVLGTCHIPCNRRQLILLDPHNPVLQHDILAEEVAQLLPAYPVSKKQALQRLPPVLRAALGSHVNVFGSEQLFRCWTERGIAMVQRRDSPASNAPHASTDSATPGSAATTMTSTMTLEEAVEELTGLIPECGLSVLSLRRMHLSTVALEALERQFGSLYNAICAFPQYFTLKHDGRRVDDSLVYLREDTTPQT